MRVGVRRNITIVFILMFLLVSCISSGSNQLPPSPTIEKTYTPTNTPIETETTPTPTQQVQPTAAPTATWDSWGFLSSVDLSQEPVSVTTYEPPDNTYLYKYAYISIIGPWPDQGYISLNLDDLSNNQPENGDIIFNHSTGSGGGFYSLYPVNGATFYYSGLHSMSYDTCLEHYPFVNMDSQYYYAQEYYISTERDYCILTDEGHLSVFRYVATSPVQDDYDHAVFEFVVTTYRQIVSQSLTPFPSSTPGPTPTPGRYSGFNLTSNQEVALDQAAQSFLDAVALGDIEKVADLVEYPLYVYDKAYDYTWVANDKTELVSLYDKFFTYDLVKEWSNASVAENMGIHDNGSLSLLTKNCAVFFYPNGKIHRISKTTFWWEEEYSK